MDPFASKKATIFDTVIIKTAVAITGITDS